MAQHKQDQDVVRLIKESQRGSHRAFRDLVNRYQQAAYGLACRMLHDKDLARDISQDAWIKVWQSIKRFDVKKSFYTWIYYVVTRLCIDYLRRHRRERPLKTATAKDKVPGPEQVLLGEERQQMINEVLIKLPARARAVLVLRDIEGLASDEVAQILGTSSGTVRWTLCEARKSFKDEWEKQGKSI